MRTRARPRPRSSAHRDDRLRVRMASANVIGVKTSNPGFVNVNPAGQPVPIRAHQGCAQLVQPYPGCLVAAMAQVLLQGESAGPMRLAGHQPDRLNTAAAAYACPGRWCPRSPTPGTHTERTSSPLALGEARPCVPDSADSRSPSAQRRLTRKSRQAASVEKRSMNSVSVRG